MNDHNALVVVKDNDFDDFDTSERLARRTFVEGFRIHDTGLGSIDSTVTQKLSRGDSIFINSLDLLGSTQEAVIDVLSNLVLKHSLRIFLPVENDVSEITPEIVEIIEAYRSLDVVLSRGSGLILEPVLEWFFDSPF